jgi:hypothetical protein
MTVLAFKISPSKTPVVSTSASPSDKNLKIVICPINLQLKLFFDGLDFFVSARNSLPADVTLLRLPIFLKAE